MFLKSKFIFSFKMPTFSHKKTLLRAVARLIKLFSFAWRLSENYHEWYKSTKNVILRNHIT
jgi:hypothetical protein